jgi:hypothetical protein
MKKEIIIIIILVLAIFLSLLFFNKMTGNMILTEDQFSEIKDLHWTHMPLTYSIDRNCGNLAENIRKSLSIIENSTNRAVYFKEGSNPDINISCSQVENCHEKKTERVWFWIITTEAVCEHESGTAQITRIKGNKIINAKINLFLVPKTKNENCSETEIHEILHIFNYKHSENNKSIMYPSKENDECNEKIDSEIANDLISKYKATS